MKDPITAYARAVERGKIPAGELQRAACVRHLREVAREWQQRSDFRWDVSAALAACEVIGQFRQFKGEWAGEPLALQDWQRFIVGSLFGWRRRRDRMRRFRTAFVEVPRGNGKSSLAAGIALYGTFLEGEPGAEGYSVATKRDQARVVFDTARQMVRRTPALRRRVRAMQHNLHQLESASKLEPLSSDARTLDGLRPHVVIADEVHAHPDSSVIDIMLSGMGTRRQPLLFEITTAGVDRHGPWWAHREYTRAVLEGVHEDPAWFGIVFGAALEDDWTDPATWRTANPGFGHQVKVDYLESECRKATRIVSHQNTFRRLYLGQLVEQADRFLDMAEWDGCGGGAVDVAALEGRSCVAGLDLSTRTDLTACVLAFPEDGGRVAVVPFFWCPEAGIEKRSRVDRVPYGDWVRQGWLTATPGNVVDFDRIRADIRRLGERFRITEIGFDPWNATQIATQLEGDGFAVVELRQGFRTLSEPTKHLAALVADGKLRHGGHPMLRWQARNLVVREDPNGNLAPDKGKAIERIDGMVALIMALARLAVRVEDASPYEQRGLVTI